MVYLLLVILLNGDGSIMRPGAAGLFQDLDSCQRVAETAMQNSLVACIPMKPEQAPKWPFNRIRIYRER